MQNHIFNVLAFRTQRGVDNFLVPSPSADVVTRPKALHRQRPAREVRYCQFVNKKFTTRKHCTARKVLSSDRDADVNFNGDELVAAGFGVENSQDALQLMQTMAQSMQGKLESVGSQLEAALEAKEKLEEELERQRKEALRARQAFELDIDSINRRKDEERTRLASEFENKIAQTKAQQEKDLAFMSSRFENERAQINEESFAVQQSLQGEIEKLIRNLESTNALAVLEVERTFASASKSKERELLEQANQRIRDLQVKLDLASSESADSLIEAEERVTLEVSSAVAEATEYTELMAIEAQMAAEVAAKRSRAVEYKLYKQTELVEKVQNSQALAAATAKKLEDSEYHVQALQTEIKELRKKMSVAESLAMESKALAEQSELLLEERTARTLQESEARVQSAEQDRDAAIRASHEAREAARMAVEAAIKRAEVAEAQLQWQEEVVRRCTKAESQESALRALSLKQDEDLATLQSQIQSLGDENARLSALTVQLTAQLQTSEDSLETRVRSAESLAEEKVASADAYLKDAENTFQLQSETAHAEVENLQFALKATTQKLAQSNKASVRNQTALRKAITDASISAKRWRERAITAEETSSWTDDSQRRPPSSAGKVQADMDPEQAFAMMASEKGRLALHVSGKERRRLMANGTRTEHAPRTVPSDESCDSLVESDWKNFRSSAGIVESLSNTDEK
ncbi:hypothetical protein CYMTET_27948 [Cymbomonas tetramitiformis]|uniref:Uncharacterized protein n=1 Tax=Cymbomonas tetramitiformis TaxID=36881 RepID=A0AAE0KWE7_9CHLO|nr:hypothetical protein CYMTET_27948 [Cymbomonas tetramitiformis]